MKESREKENAAKREPGLVDEYGRCSVSRKLEAAVRRKAGDYMANRLLRDNRLPREEMAEDERKRVLLGFIEAMTYYLGKEDAKEILVEVRRGERAQAPRAMGGRAKDCEGDATS